MLNNSVPLEEDMVSVSFPWCSLSLSHTHTHSHTHRTYTCARLFYYFKSSLTHFKLWISTEHALHFFKKPSLFSSSSKQSASNIISHLIKGLTSPTFLCFCDFARSADDVFPIIWSVLPRWRLWWHQASGKSWMENGPFKSYLVKSD